MRNLKKLSVATTGAAIGSVVIALVTGIAEKAVAQTLTFEGIENLQPVGNFYDLAPNDFNITFSPNALGLVDSDAGGNGNFSNEPSPSTVLTLETPTPITLNSSVGLVNSLSFSYVSAFVDSNPASVRVYDGPDGTGNVLASQTLPLTPVGVGDPNGGDYDFGTGPNPVTVAFPGIARSVQFDATSSNPIGGFVGFDDINTTPIPEPSSILGFLTFGAVGAGLMLKRKRGNQK